MDYLIGLDIGTTNIKALVIDAHGRQIVCAKRPSPFEQYGVHQVYFADSFWKNVCHLLADAVAGMRTAGANPADVRGISVASMGEMGFPMGRDGALFPAISWYDPCSEPYAALLREKLGFDAQMRILGQKLLHIFTVSKLMYLKAEEPDVYERMETWLCMSDYVTHRLCASKCMDLSIAARTGMLDWRKKQWSETVICEAGLDTGKLPQLVQSGTPVGSLLKEAAEATGLPEGIPVMAGGHDHVCESFACSAGREGILVNSSGTTESLLLAQSDEGQMHAAGRAGFNIGPHARRDMYYVMGAILASGASVDWYKRKFGEQAHLPDTIGSLTYLPHLRGSSSPSRNVRSRGAFLGLTDRHGPADFMQAVYEGIAFELRNVAEGVSGDRRFDRIVGVGGGYQNARWAQLKADILQAEIHVPQIGEATALGAALLAGVGSGVYAGADEALAAAYHPGKCYHPSETHRAYYEEKYGVYRTLYQTLAPTNAALSNLNK